jgi:hypothetical protein
MPQPIQLSSIWPQTLHTQLSLENFPIPHMATKDSNIKIKPRISKVVLFANAIVNMPPKNNPSSRINANNHFEGGPMLFNLPLLFWHRLLLKSLNNNILSLTSK